MAVSIETIHGWHAHVYYDPTATRAVAEQLRAEVAARYPAAVLGRWHDAHVGPHTQSMYQIRFENDLFATLVPFLALNRAGLDILVHPESGDEYADHLEHALWLGNRLAIDGWVLRRGTAG